MSSPLMPLRSISATPKRSPTPELKLLGLLLLLLLVSGGCASRPIALPPECLAPPAPPAWMMEKQPSSLPLLDKIISPSGPS